jgi:hypothetical protein
MKMQNFKKTYITTAVAASMLALSACGGSSSSSSSEDDGAPVFSRGVITGFGSVYVNGRRFQTDDTRFEIDDDSSNESELRIGMVVTVLGTHDSDGDHADRIIYDNELKGPVTDIQIDPDDVSIKTLTILGQMVVVNAATTIDDDGNLSFGSVAIGDVLEVSGYNNGTQLIATHIELQDDDDEIEIKGIIENLMANSFEINGFAISYDSSTDIDDDIATLADGQYVEVEGQLDLAGTTLIAEEIESEDDDYMDNDDDVEIEGAISDFDETDNSFRLYGLLVDASTASVFPLSLVLVNGLVVEVEGHIVNKVLVAEEIKQKGNKTKISAELSAVDSTVGSTSVSFSFNGSDVLVNVSSQTELEDETGNPVNLLSDFSAGDFVELEAFADPTGVINATEIERENPNEIEIEAAVQDFDAGTQSISLLGIEFDLSAASFENKNDINISAAEFFGQLAIGQFIEIKDADQNGVFEKAELED